MVQMHFVRSGKSKDILQKVEISYTGRAPMAQAVVIDGSVVPRNTGAQRSAEINNSDLISDGETATTCMSSCVL